MQAELSGTDNRSPPQIRDVHHMPRMSLRDNKMMMYTIRLENDYVKRCQKDLYVIIVRMYYT